MRNRTSSGVDVKSMLRTMAFTAMLLPVPVAPAMSRWGILARSAMKAPPDMSFPRARLKRERLFEKAWHSTISLKSIFSLTWFGTSMPTTDLPGMGAIILMDRAFMASARSSERLSILPTLTPGAGSNSYMVTTGPGCISRTLPSMPKSRSVLLSILEFSRRALESRLPAFSGGWSRSSDEGSLKEPLGLENSSCSSTGSGVSFLALVLLSFIFGVTMAGGEGPPPRGALRRPGEQSPHLPYPRAHGLYKGEGRGDCPYPRLYEGDARGHDEGD